MQMIFQDPYASLNPRWRVGAIIDEPIFAFRLRRRASRRRAGSNLLGSPPGSANCSPRRPRSRRRAQISARILRRPAPAHRDRARARLEPRFHRLRRADLGPRRVGPGADPQPHARPAGAARPHLSVDHPQPRRRPLHGERGSASCISAGSSRSARPTALFARPRHPYTRMLLDAVPDLAMSGRRAHARRRRAAEPDRSAARLPVPSALPAGDRRLQDRGPALRGQRRLPSRAG